MSEVTRHIVETACPLDCPDSCRLTVSIHKGRSRPSMAGTPIPSPTGTSAPRSGASAIASTAPIACARPASASGRRARHVRVGPWERGARTTSPRLLRGGQGALGRESVLPFYYGGSNGLLTQDTTDARLFRRFGASRLARTVCARRPRARPTGPVRQDAVGHLPGLRACPADRGLGRQPVGVRHPPGALHPRGAAPGRDARRDRSASHAARAAGRPAPAVRPGTDVAVALAMHRYLFEAGRADQRVPRRAHARRRAAARARRRWTFERAAEVAGVDGRRPAAAGRALRRRLAGPDPLRLGPRTQPQRRQRGVAILALPAVAGKFGVRGGGYTLSNSASVGHRRRRGSARTNRPTRLVNMNHLGRMLIEATDPPVKVLFVYNCNPLATMPDQNRVRRGLEREDLFTVVFDQVMTDTARYADVVLPATTFLEHYDFARAYGPISLQLTPPVIDAVGEARPNVDVFAELERRLGLARGRTARRARDDAARPRRAARGVGTASAARTRGPARPGGTPVQFVDVFPRTPDGKVAPVPGGTRSRGAAGALRLPARSGHGRVPAGAALAVEREDDQLVARRARAAAGP